MNEEIQCITNEEKHLRMNGKMMTDFLRALYCTYEKLGKFFFHTYSITCLRKNSSILLKVINI